MALTRRDFGRNVIGGLAATTLGGVGACESGSDYASDAGLGGTDAGAGGTDGAASCIVYPQQTEGPYYLDLDTLRRDITEGKAGASLEVVLQVQRADCTPLADVALDLWHCDAAGVYSGFPGQIGGLDTTGETFLRGTQLTDDEGIARFDTIYPGWYPGRTTHIHFKVHTSTFTEATSQLYFPEDVTAEIYETPPYDARGQKNTSNQADTISSANPTPLAMVTGNGSSGYVASILITVA
ncbi:MAG: hypothetical protein AMJ62_05305 [Myxococcales bacterium SG8_38]|nr:MAG: hypothetical protein AMJ62_05305 [Myxococcales bacterium SG8_38]